MENKNTPKLFLDDYRIPKDCILYMHRVIKDKNPIYLQEDWNCAVDYNSFVEQINAMYHNNRFPEIVSLDHDLADIDNAEGEKTGYDCLKYLLNFLDEHNLKQPEIFFHSANPVGVDNMKNYLSSWQDSKISTEVLREGVEVFGTEQEFKEWLDKPNAFLDFKKPLELSDKEILDELARIKNGIV